MLPHFIAQGHPFKGGRKKNLTRTRITDAPAQEENATGTPSAVDTGGINGFPSKCPSPAHSQCFIIPRETPTGLI